MSEQYFGPSIANMVNEIINEAGPHFNQPLFERQTDPEMERLLDQAFPERKRSQ